MANDTIKISQLNELEVSNNEDFLPIVDSTEVETKKITKQNLLTDIDAKEVQIGQLTEATQINDEDYLIITQNGTNKKISKANAKFASGDEVYVDDTEPIGEDDDSVKFWIEPSEDSVDAEGTYISNEYGIAQDKGYSQEYINKLLAYSTDEKRVGTFVDGKPTYRKTIYISGNLTYDGNGYAYIDTNISNIDVLIDFTGQVQDSTSGHLPLPYINIGKLDYGLAMSMTNDNRIVVVNNAYDNPRLSKFVFNLEYTKTTD